MAKTSAPSLGSLLRALRARRGWTLKQMSDKTGIPVSTLSKVEHDRLTLTYDKLLQLSQRLNMRMSELFAESDVAAEPAAVTARRSIGSLDQAVEVSTPNYEYHYLCPELRRKRMIPVIAKLRARSLEAFGELVRHPGEEFVFVLKGSIEVHTEFYDPVVLSEGQSIYLDSTMGHAYVVADGCEEATVMAVNSAAEEGLLQSLMSLHAEDEERPPSPAPLRRKAAGRG